MSSSINHRNLCIYSVIYQTKFEVYRARAGSTLRSFLLFARFRHVITVNRKGGCSTPSQVAE